MVGPEYVPASKKDWKRLFDLSKPTTRDETRDFDFLPCPICGRRASRLRVVERIVHDIGDLTTGLPVDIRFRYSQHRCLPCKKYFHAEFPEWIVGALHYTRPVVETAIRVVVEDGLPYESASWHMWRDHRVFVPWGTIQNWVEAAGKKSGHSGPKRVSRRRVRDLLRLHRRR